MKTFLKILPLVVLLTSCYCQLKTEKTFYCDQIETTRYRIDTKGAACAIIDININGQWKSYDIISEPLGTFEFSVQEKELNNIGSKELILRWVNSEYGSGGGTVKKGLQLWDLDSATLLFDEIIFCSMESFGRGNGNAFINVCEKKIEIINKTIMIEDQICELDVQNDINLDCELSKINTGQYTLMDSLLKKK
jgi:hypothetical protein